MVMLLTVALTIFGILLVLWGIYILRGPVNVWLIEQHGWGYGIGPVGLIISSLGFALLPFTPDNWRLPLILVGLVIFFIGLLLPQSLLDPPWMKWLKNNHQGLLPLLEQEIYRVGFLEWNRRIKTQEQLKAWIEAVRHNLNENEA